MDPASADDVAALTRRILCYTPDKFIAAATLITYFDAEACQYSLERLASIFASVTSPDLYAIQDN